MKPDVILHHHILFWGLLAKPSGQQRDQHPYLLIAGTTTPLYSNKYTHVSHLQTINCVIYGFLCGPGSEVSIVTSYGLDGPGIQSRWVGKIFHTWPDWPWGPVSLLYNGHQVFHGGKERSGRDADPSPPSSAVGHKRVELYVYSPYGPYGLYRASVPVQGCTLSLPLWVLKA